MINSHRWIDVSRHGSSLWKCEFCGTYQGSDSECAKAEKMLAREADAKDVADRSEYAALVSKRNREMYLDRKYGV